MLISQESGMPILFIDMYGPEIALSDRLRRDCHTVHSRDKANYLIRRIKGRQHLNCNLPVDIYKLFLLGVKVLSGLHTPVLYFLVNCLLSKIALPTNN